MYDDELLISANPVGTYAKSKGKMMSCECDLKSRGERWWRERGEEKKGGGGGRGGRDGEDDDVD